MKTELKIKELLNIVNPSKDGIKYNEELIKIDFIKLAEYVNNPKKMKVFIADDNNETNLYKNIALYIINADSNTKKYIDLDLNEKSPIRNGIFEYVKSIYNKEKSIIINISEDGDNQLLIKAQKLQNIDLSDNKDVNLEKAKDIQMAKLTSIFTNAKKMSVEKIVENERFFWKESNPDLFTDKNFLLSKIKTMVDRNNYGRELIVKTDFYNLMEKANNDYVQSDEFKLELLNLNNKIITDILINSKSNYSKKISMEIDFNKNIFKDKILNDMKEGRFIILEKLFAYNHKNRVDGITYDIDFNYYINRPETLNHFKSQIISSEYTLSSVFCLESCYSYLTKENKLNKDIIGKYIETISKKNIHDDININNSLLFEIPVEKFHEEEFLIKILPHLNIKDFNRYLLKENQTSPLLSDINFIKENTAIISDYKLIEILDFFMPAEKINKEFIKDLVKSNPGIYSVIISLSDEKVKFIKPYIKDIDVIYQAYVSGLKITDISFNDLKEEFIKVDSNKKIEIFKLKYLIVGGYLEEAKTKYTTNEELSIYQEKYNKLEYLFFKTNGWFHGNQARVKLLKTIDEPSKLNDLLKSINEVWEQLPLEFDSKTFYNNLKSELRNDFELVKFLMDKGTLEYTDLSENLQYNKNIALFFIKKNENTIKNVPVEFFNDIDFSLEFTKLIDAGIVHIENAPLFINKFFENQGITKDYQNNLKTYISYMEMKEDIPVEVEQSSKTKKRKI